MHTLALYGVVAHQLVFLVQTLLIGQTFLSLQCRELGCDIGQNKQFVIVHLLSQPCGTLIGKVARVHLLFNHEIQRLYTLWHTTVVVLHVDVLSILHTSLDTFL